MILVASVIPESSQLNSPVACGNLRCCSRICCSTVRIIGSRAGGATARERGAGLVFISDFRLFYFGLRFFSGADLMGCKRALQILTCVAFLATGEGFGRA